jgi:hypothetical protein
MHRTAAGPHGVGVHGITSRGPYHIATVRAYETSWKLPRREDLQVMPEIKSR